MRIAEEQLPPEVNAQLRDKGALFLQPDELSVWALTTLLADSDPNVSLLPQDAEPSSA
jgi:hypothetical protein